MALKNFYKTSGGNWVIGKYSNVTPGDFVSEINGVGKIFVYKFGETKDQLVSGLPTSFCDEAGVAYADLAAFETATDGFFVKASGDAGQTAVTYAELETLIGNSGLTAGGQYKLTDFATKHFLTNGLVVQAYNYGDAPAPTGITITPDAVGANPTAYFYKICAVNTGSTLRSEFSAEIETSEGVSTGFVILAATIPADFTAFALFKGTATGVYTEVSSVSLVSALPADVYGTFAAENGLLSTITALPILQVSTGVPAEVTGATETLILTATSPNTLAKEVSSVEFPNDKLEYDWNPANWDDNVNFSELVDGTPTGVRLQRRYYLPGGYNPKQFHRL
jgi:hypothetical protein